MIRKSMLLWVESASRGGCEPGRGDSRKSPGSACRKNDDE
jgi:hypothetical protein